MTYKTVLYWCVLTYWVSVLTGESHSRWSMFQCASLRGSPASSGETPVPGWDWSPQGDPTAVCCINSPGITIGYWEFTQRKGSLPADSHKQSPRSKYNKAAARAKKIIGQLTTITYQAASRWRPLPKHQDGARWRATGRATLPPVPFPPPRLPLH